MHSPASTISSTSCGSNTVSTEALQLPELLETIAAFLQDSRADLVHGALVCRAWSEVFTARLWHTLDMPPVHKEVFVTRIPRYGHHVRSLQLVGQFDQNLLFESCPQIALLDLTLARGLNTLSLSRMTELLPRLRVLRLDCCYGQGLAWLASLMHLEYLQELLFVNDAPENLNDDMLSNQAGQPLLLEHGLDVEDDEADPHGINTADAETDDLEELQFMVPQDGLSSDGEEHGLRIDHLGAFLTSRASTLTRLSLEGSDLTGFNLLFSVDSSPLALKYLNLAKTCIYKPRSVVEPLLRQCPDLRVFDVSGNFETTWDGFQWSIFAQHCLKLTSLNLGQLSSIDNDQLIQVIRQCRSFCCLSAPQSNLQSKVLDAIVERQASGQGVASPFLELDISWCSDIEQEAVERVLEQLSTLQSIKFSWCQRVELSIFRSRWSCLELEELEAQGLDKPAPDQPVSSTHEAESLETFVFGQISRLRSLRHLVIGSDEMVVSNENGFGQLGGCVDICSDATMLRVSCRERLGHLKHLELVGSEKSPLGMAEMMIVAGSFPRLRQFHFGLGLVPPEMQTWLAGRRPDVQQEEQRIYY